MRYTDCLQSATHLSSTSLRDEITGLRCSLVNCLLCMRSTADRACVIPAQRPVIALSRLTAHALPCFTGVYKALKCFVDCQVLRDAVEEKARHREVEQRLIGAREGLGR